MTGGECSRAGETITNDHGWRQSRSETLTPTRRGRAAFATFNTMNTPELPRIDRRTAIKWMLTASASLAMAPHLPFAQQVATAFDGAGYGTDPFLNKSYKPGDFWPLTLTPAQRQTVAALCDVIIPADGKSPSASTVGVHDFIDEWISAPYPAQVADRALILEGLEWIEAESRKRFGLAFVNTIARQKAMLCDDICHEPDAKEEFKQAARFFAKFRDLTAAGFYTTPQGMKDVGYIGNVPLATFDGPPPELIKQLGLDQA